MKKIFCYFLLNIPKTPYVYDIVRINKLIQIEPLYSFYDYKKEYDIFHYNTKYRRLFKNYYYKPNLIDNHHIIPKEFIKHPLIKELNIDLSCSKNIFFLPNRYAKEKLYDYSVIYHDSHPKYNKFILKELNQIYLHDNIELKQYEFWLFFYYLYNGLKNNDPIIKSMIQKY